MSALAEEKSPAITEKDIRIAKFVTQEIEDGDTLQIGIGAVPNAVMAMLKNHRHLGIHTEMLTDSIVDLSCSWSGRWDEEVHT